MNVEAVQELAESKNIRVIMTYVERAPPEIQIKGKYELVTHPGWISLAHDVDLNC
jgi:hypothetical protein